MVAERIAVSTTVITRIESKNTKWQKAKTLKILSIPGNVTNLAQLKQTERTKYVKIEAIKSGRLRTLGPGKVQSEKFRARGFGQRGMCAEGKLGYGLMRATRLGKWGASLREVGRVEKQEWCMGGENG